MPGVMTYGMTTDQAHLSICEKLRKSGFEVVDSDGHSTKLESTKDGSKIIVFEDTTMTQ